MNDPEPTLFSPSAGERGMSDLHYAAYCGDLENLLFFLDQGLAVNEQDTYRGYTPVHWVADMAAVDGPRIEMIRELVKRGANINIRSANGKTPLMLARESGSMGGDELAEELVSLGAKEA